MAESARLKLFISYSHKDEALREALCAHLSQLEHDQLIEPWHDRQIRAGEDWAGAIDGNLQAADIVLLLVSADFLKSEYCYGIEMELALRRERDGLARVIPVILRPCDWQTAPFGALQALPRNAKPLEEWPSADRFFTEVARGLRETIQQRRAQPAFNPVKPGRRRPWLMPAAAGLLGLAAAISWMALKPPPELASALELARHAMAAGRYPEAMRQYGRAKALDAANPQALLGEKKAALAEKITHDAHDDRAGFWGELQTLRQAAPKDGDLLMLEGDLRLRDPQPENRALARPLYLQALQAEPRLAEAHFRLGVLSAQAGDAKDAIQHYQDAAKLEPDEKYLGNLAEQYFRQGQYPQAIQAYEALDEYPLAWLEAAKAHWALGEPQKASDGQAQALRWLDSPQILALPKNRVQWLLDSGFSVATASCQRYYAALALSASRFMSGTLENPPEAGGCGQPGEIRKAVAEDLKRYAAPRSPQAEAFAKRLAQ